MSEANKDSTVGKAASTTLRESNRRRKHRAKIAQQVRVRPSEPRGDDFDEVLDTINVCRDGVYFATERSSYTKGMRLFITYPYSTGHGAINQEYVGEVVRVDRLPGERSAVAVHLKMKLNLGTHPTYHPDHR